MTGPKRIKSRMNKRTKVRKSTETRGGAHVKVTRTSEQKSAAVAECRDQLIEQLKAVCEDPTLLGKHWIHPWVKMIRDPGRLLTTTSGTKLIANLTDMIFCGGPPPTRPSGGLAKLPPEPEIPQGEGIKLPPLRPDAAGTEKAAA